MKKSCLFLLFAVVTTACIAQSTIELLGPAGSGGPSGTGPVTSNQQVTFYSSAATPFSPAVTATYSLSNQQFSSIEGNPSSPGAQFGGNISSSANSPVPGSNIYDFMNVISSSVNANYTSCNACAAGTGIDVAANRSIPLLCFSDALINSSGTQLYPVNARVHYADLTITFNRPVSNPLLHITGLGGFVSYSTTLSGATINYDLGFTTDMDLLTSGLSLSKVSGNPYLSVTSAGISNSSAKLGSSTAGTIIHGITRNAASGTVAVIGTNITALTFRVYLRGDGGSIVDNSGNNVAATNGNIVRWSFHSGFIPGGTSGVLENISGDQILIGLSLDQPVTVNGNVFNDPDGGNVNNSTGSTNLVPSGLYANLTDANGKVVETATVNTDGTYSLPAVFAGTYTVNISTSAGVQGATVPAAAIPVRWNFTGEFNGNPNTGNDGNANGTSSTFTVASTNISDVNFGIQRAPQSAVNVQPLQSNPGNFINFTVPAAAFQTSNTGGAGNTLDFDGGTVTKIRILSFPTFCNSLTTNGTTYISGTTCAPGLSCVTWPSAGVTVNYTNGTGVASPVQVDPLTGNVSVKISFAAIDNSGVEDPATGSVTLPFGSILAVRLKTFTARTNDQNVLLNWEMADESSADHYDAEYSNDGVSFSAVGSVISNSSMRYSLVHKNPGNGIHYYRLKLFDKNGSITYSGIEKVNFGGHENITIYPSPVRKNVYINLDPGTSYSGAIIQLTSIDGRVLLQQKINPLSVKQAVDISTFPQGKYIIQIKSNAAVITKIIEVLR